MADETSYQEPEPLSKADKRILTCVIVFASCYAVWLTMFSPSPKFYSYKEYERANAQCQGHKDLSWCVGDALIRWRRDNPDAPRGSR